MSGTTRPDFHAPRPPLDIRLTVLSPVPCPYLPDRIETIRAVMTSSIDGDTYRAFMDAGFRRSGKMLYQPVCEGCRECIPLRVDVNAFAMSPSQKRCWKRNSDLVVEVGRPELTDEKHALYVRYVKEWHGKPEEADRDAMYSFLYDSPTDTIEFTYRDPAGQLLAVGIGDLSSRTLSSVYFYFDPGNARRSLGTFGALHEIGWCRQRGLSHYYLGFWVRDCGAMSYKSTFRPFETMQADGSWKNAVSGCQI